jgi:hypothetical protein
MADRPLKLRDLRRILRSFGVLKKFRLTADDGVSDADFYGR